MKNYIIFAMRHISKYIVDFQKNLLNNNKGTVPHSYNCNVLDVCRNSGGLYPHFMNLTNFLMRHTENKVISIAYILLLTSSAYNFFYFLSGISKTFFI